MLLEGENTQFEMKVVGYEYPDLENEPYDSDWLNITIRVSLPQGSWTSTDPCLLTYELAHLADWLESIAEGKGVDSEASFIEPNLRFEVVGSEERKLRVYFELECRPSWAPYEGAGMEDLWAEFGIEPKGLIDAAASLRAYSKRFPTRAGY